MYQNYEFYFDNQVFDGIHLHKFIFFFILIQIE